MFNVILQEAAVNDAAQGGGMMNLVFIVGIIFVFYFFMIRPQNKQRKKLEEERNAMKIGDNVVTSSGIFGKIDGINKTTDQKGNEIVESFIIKLKPDYNTRIVVYKDCVNKDISELGQQ